MSYSWAEAITQNTTILKASHFTELHTNIDAERTYRGLAGYSWTQTPTQYVHKQLNNDLVEMRTALDQAHTENTCHTDNSSYWPGDDNTYNATVETGHYSSHNSSYNGSHIGTYA